MQHPWLRSQGVAADKPLDSVVLQRMRKLSATNKLKKAALVVMAKSLNPDEINGLQQLFRSIDADNSGTITIDELRTALTSCNGHMSVCARSHLPCPVLNPHEHSSTLSERAQLALCPGPEGSETFCAGGGRA
jgi:hypothetical protein